jgi:hypothetical protein
MTRPRTARRAAERKRAPDFVSMLAAARARGDLGDNPTVVCRHYCAGRDDGRVDPDTLAAEHEYAARAVGDGVLVARVIHDEDCRHWAGRRCGCGPAIVVVRVAHDALRGAA